MRKRPGRAWTGRYLLGFAALVWLLPASANGVFDGLEMDVIAPGETPKGPAARIALPPASSLNRPLSHRGASGYEDSIADTLIRPSAERSFGPPGTSNLDGAGGSSSLAPPAIEKPQAPARP